MMPVLFVMCNAIAPRVASHRIAALEKSGRGFGTSLIS
jgi:hypothetical protein